MVVCGGRGGGGGCLQGLHMFYRLASDVKSFCIRVSLLGSFSLVFYPQRSHPSCLTKYVVSILDSTVFQCDGAWWLPLTGCHGYPTRSARCDLCLHLSVRHHSPSSSIIDGFNPKQNAKLLYKKTKYK